MAVEKRNTIQWRCSPMVWLWKNVRQNIQAKKMVDIIRTITPQELNELDNANIVKFKVRRGSCRRYLPVVNDMVRACCGDFNNERRTVWDIPVTVPDDGGVYVVRLNGSYGGNYFNGKRLMGARRSNYFYAFERDGVWYQVKDSPYPIEGAVTLSFKGSYTELLDPDGTTGLSSDNMCIGREPLMFGLTALFFGRVTLKHFLTVCVNLFEACRYPSIADLVNRSTSIALPRWCLSYIYRWGKMSDAVRSFKDTEVWDYNNPDNNEDVLPINEFTIIGILGMAKF